MGKFKAALGRLFMGDREIEVHDIEIETFPKIDREGDGFTGFAPGAVETTIAIDTMTPEAAAAEAPLLEGSAEVPVDQDRLKQWQEAARAMRGKDPHLSAIMAARMGKAAGMGSMGPSDALRAAAMSSRVAAAAGSWTPESGTMPDIDTIAALASATGQSMNEVARVCEIAIRATAPVIPRVPAPPAITFPKVPVLPSLPSISLGSLVPAGTRPGKMCATCSYWRGPMLLEDGTRIGECDQDPGTTRAASSMCGKYARCSQEEIDRREQAAPTEAALVVADESKPAPPQKLTPAGRDRILEALERAKRVRGGEE